MTQSFIFSSVACGSFSNEDTKLLINVESISRQTQADSTGKQEVFAFFYNIRTRNH